MAGLPLEVSQGVSPFLTDQGAEEIRAKEIIIERIPANVASIQLGIAELPAIQRVVDSWLENTQNIARLEGKANASMRFSSAVPVLYMDTPAPGTSARPFPDKFVVLIALGVLNRYNGLPVVASYLGLNELTSGQDMIFSGDENQIYRGLGGGCSVTLVFQALPARTHDAFSSVVR